MQTKPYSDMSGRLSTRASIPLKSASLEAGTDSSDEKQCKHGIKNQKKKRGRFSNKNGVEKCVLDSCTNGRVAKNSGFGCVRHLAVKTSNK